MFARIAASWELVKASAAVLRDDQELVVFPIISSFGVMIVTLTFIVPMLLATAIDARLFGFQDNLGPLFYLVLFLFYLAQYFVIFFANTALVGAATIRLSGGNPTLRDGLEIAYERIGAVFGYALIAATVGLLLRIISERGGAIGRIITSFLGVAWNVTTFLVVPVLVVEEVGPIEAIKRSGQLLRQTWGEQIVGNFGIGAIFGLAIVGVLLVGVPVAILAAMTNSMLLVGLVVALVVMAILALVLIQSTLSSIYTAAVYTYATEGNTGGYFRDDLIQGAFREK
jgi:hypothetical protein